MNRIHSLQINNFKFFQNQEPIVLKSNHLLLYGENGSGKSSLYWALYTLFEASLKFDDQQIKKYFSKTIFNGDDSLVNIHALETAPDSDDFNSFIELRTDDIIPTIFKISKNDVEIRDNEEAKKINYASDYINYKLLLNFSGFSHSDHIDLSGLFINNIFTYIRFPGVEITRNGNKNTLTSASEIWSEIIKGPDEFDPEHNYLEAELIEYMGSAPFTDFEKTFTDFHERLSSLIDYINLHGPEYLKKLGYEYPYLLNLKSGKFRLSANKYKLTPFQIGVQIPEYEGIAGAIKKPHSFLNEAKFSAMAISIRLAILKRKLQEDCLKFIVLDDLLISLDMSNRENVLSVLLSDEFASNYQILILTHDLPFFQMCKRKISDAEQTNWVYYEMYANEEKHIPVILPSGSYYAKALNHLKRFDYPAAGNYFRKATEEILESQFPREIPIAENGEKRTTLRGYIDAAIKFYERIGQSTANLKTLDNYLFILLNPLSHRAIDADVYRVELNKVKDILLKIEEEIKALNFREIVASNNTLVIHFVLDETTEHEYFIKTDEAIYLYNNGGQDSISNSRCKSFKSTTKINGGETQISRNGHYDFKNIVDVHKQIFIVKERTYDNSYLTNVFQLDEQSQVRKSLKQIIEEL
jgi:energy-coupling factor transporter ATP-binding protein EcfA2